MSADVWACDHEQTAVRRRRQSNGILVLCQQCLRCGRALRNYAKGAPEVMRLATIDDFDVDLAAAWLSERQEMWRQRQSAYQDQAAADRARAEAEWRRQYDAHLVSAAWADLRARVLERDRHVCQGCGLARATEVHHLTYAHLGDEFLFELTSLCRPCHLRYHGRADGYDGEFPAQYRVGGAG